MQLAREVVAIALVAEVDDQVAAQRAQVVDQRAVRADVRDVVRQRRERGGERVEADAVELAERDAGHDRGARVELAEQHGELHRGRSNHTGVASPGSPL